MDLRQAVGYIGDALKDEADEQLRRIEDAARSHDPWMGAVHREVAGALNRVSSLVLALQDLAGAAEGAQSAMAELTQMLKDHAESPDAHPHSHDVKMPAPQVGPQETTGGTPTRARTVPAQVRKVT
jgi:hypothetical protein